MTKSLLLVVTLLLLFCFIFGEIIPAEPEIVIKKQSPAAKGRSTIVDIFNVSAEKLKSIHEKPEKFVDSLKDALKGKKINILKEMVHKSNDGSKVSVILIGKNERIILHTYPSSNQVAADVLVFSQNQEESKKEGDEIVETISFAFEKSTSQNEKGQESVEQISMERGNEEHIATVLPITSDLCVNSDDGSLEWQVVRRATTLEEFKTKKDHKMKVIQHKKLGKCMIQDDWVKFCDNDMHSYGKTLINNAMNILKRGETEKMKILVLEGSNGIAANTLLQKWSDLIDSVQVVAHDSSMQAFIERHFPDIFEPLHKQSDRVQFTAENSKNFLEKVENKYDLIVIDNSNPEACGEIEELYQKPFYKLAISKLKEGGVFVQAVENLDDDEEEDPSAEYHLEKVMERIKEAGFKDIVSWTREKKLKIETSYIMAQKH